MFGFSKKLAKTVLQNVDKIDDAAKITDPLEKAEAFVRLKKEIKSSFRSLNTISHLKTGLTGIVTVASLPVTIPSTVLALITFELGLADSGISEALLAPTAKVMDMWEKINKTRKRKDTDLQSLLDKCNSELSEIFQQDPDVFSKIPAIKKAFSTRGELKAAFSMSAGKRKDIEEGYKSVQDLALCCLQPRP